MTRPGLVSAAWTAVVVACGTLALAGIVAFMAHVHRSWPPAPLHDAPSMGAASGAVEVRPEPEAPRRPAGIGVPGEAGPASDPAATVDEPATGEVAGGTDALVAELRRRALTIPVRGVAAGALVRSFDQARGDRRHEALDIMAPAGTPVVAVEDGTVAKLFTSEAGGLTIYQFDPSRVVAYYYAHLDAYAQGLTEGATVRRGEVIGYVGSTGNADAQAPHLHFAVFELGPDRRWWEGTPIDPYEVIR